MDRKSRCEQINKRPRGIAQRNPQEGRRKLRGISIPRKRDNLWTGRNPEGGFPFSVHSRLEQKARWAAASDAAGGNETIPSDPL
jgi:hypothetical protein